MKQTVTILTALMIALLLVSGFVVLGSMRQSQSLLDKEESIRALQTERDHLRNENERQTREMERSAQLLSETVEERDALNRQWNDALLSSQEANDALALSEDRAKEQAQRIADLERRVAELLNELDSAQEAMAAHTPAPAPLPTRIEREIR